MDEPATVHNPSSEPENVTPTCYEGAAEPALCGATVQVLERRAEAMKAQSINVPTAAAVQRQVLERVGSFSPKANSRFTGHFAGGVLDAALVDWSDPRR